MPRWTRRVLAAAVFAGLGWLLATVLAVAVLLLLPTEAEDDPTFLAGVLAGGSACVLAGAALGWRRGGRSQ